MLITLVMIIMAIIAASGFIALGLSFVGHKLQAEKERKAGKHKRATFQAHPSGRLAAGDFSPARTL
jgi:hypothetical protein